MVKGDRVDKVAICSAPFHLLPAREQISIALFILQHPFYIITQQLHSFFSRTNTEFWYYLLLTLLTSILSLTYVYVQYYIESFSQHKYHHVKNLCFLAQAYIGSFEFEELFICLLLQKNFIAVEKPSSLWQGGRGEEREEAEEGRSGGRPY